MIPEIPIETAVSASPVSTPRARRAREFAAAILQSHAQVVESVYTRIARGAFWSLAGTGVGQGLMFLTATLSAKLLGAERYGQLGLIVSTVSLFSLIATAGLGTTAIKHVAEYRRSAAARAGRIIGLSCVIAIVSGVLVAGTLILLAPYLSDKVLKSADLMPKLRLGAILLFFGALNGAQTGALTGFEAFRELAIASAWKGAVTASAVLLLTTRFGVAGAILGYGIASFVVSGIYHSLLRKQCRISGIPLSYSGWKAELPVMWGFSIPVLVASLPLTPVAWWCNAMLATKAGYSELGVFTAAFQFQYVLLFFSSCISSIALPVLSNTVPERDFARYTRFLKISTLATVASVLIIAVPVMLLAPLLIKFFGPGFHGGITVLRIVCLSTLIGTLNSAVPHAIWSLSATRAGVLLSFLRCALLVGSASALVHKGALGLALAYLITAVVQTSTECVYLWRLLEGCKRRWAVRAAA